LWAAVNVGATIALDYGHFGPFNLFLLFLSAPSFHLVLFPLAKKQGREWTLKEYQIFHVASLLATSLLCSIPMIVLLNLSIKYHDEWPWTSVCLFFNTFQLILLAAVVFLSFAPKEKELADISLFPSCFERP